MPDPAAWPATANQATTVDIDAPPEIVFAHLVTPEGMLAWMGQQAELDPTPGGVFAVDGDALARIDSSEPYG